MWELDHNEDWSPKNWCFWTVVLEKTLESSLDCKIKPVNPKGYQPWIFIGRTDIWSWNSNTLATDAKRQFIEKDPNDGKDRRQEEKGVTEDEMVGWHHWLNGHEFEQAPGDNEGQGSLMCCSPWGRKELNMTEQLKNNSSAGDTSSIPGSGRSTAGGSANLLQYSCLENPMDGGAWRASVHEVTKSRTQLSKWTTSAIIRILFGAILFVWITTNFGKFLKRWEYQTTWPASWEICMQVRKQQLELDMGQQTGSKSGMEYVIALYIVTLLI